MKTTVALVLASITALAACADKPVSPYAGQQMRSIKALSDAEAKGLLEGAGLGFAKPAELNGYPGPMHVLDNAAALGVDESQRQAIRAILDRHKAEARALGAELVRLESELDRLFATHAAQPERIDATLSDIGRVTARLRASHLKAHLQTTALLTPQQVDRYAALRGYNDGNPEEHTGHRPR